MQTTIQKPNTTTTKTKTKNQVRTEKNLQQIGRKVGSLKANKAIKKQEYKQILDYMENDKDTRLTTLNKYRKIFTFLFYTGCRINEVLKLKTEDIQSILDYGKARIITSKTERYAGQEFRVVHFSPLAISEIRKEFNDILKHPNAYCIRAYNNKDKEMNKIGLTNQLNRYLEKIFGNKDFTTHSFRRGLIREMIIDNNVNGKIVQKFIGHKNLSTTNEYLKVTDEDIQNSLIR